jgi:hypothetical protein
VPYGFRRKLRPNVKVDVFRRAHEHPVPVPPRLSKNESVPEPFQGGDVAGLLRRITAPPSSLAGLGRLSIFVA